MVKLASILTQRFKKKEQTTTVELTEQLSEKLPEKIPEQNNQLTPFASLFGVKKPGEKDKEQLEILLEKYKMDDSFDYTQDVDSLLEITSEVKAINNQAAILHGERIKHAQEILKKYKEGAFTAWLKATYGNRQTPYNFLQYFLFYSNTPKELHNQIEVMPRQAIYTLASRQGEQQEKEEIVRNFKGESKVELLSIIRKKFPLNESDKRKENIVESSLTHLKRLVDQFERPNLKMTQEQNEDLLKQVKQLERLIKNVQIFDN